MKTLYVDVYFLINFCVDVLALGLALRFLKITTSFLRLIVSGIVGALYAVCAILLSDYKAIMYPIGAVLFIIMILLVTKGISINRKLKYSIAFFTFEILIGGLVYFSYCLLDKIFQNGEYGEIGGENRNILIWALIILLSYGVVKILMYVFSGTSNERVVRLCVGFAGKEESFDALVDTGNLATDPSDRRPVVFITQELAERIIGKNPDFENGINALPEELKRRLRLIPMNKNGDKTIAYGFLGDYVTAVKGKKYANISVTLAIDTKGDTYGGYQALLPASAIDNVF